jgi:hypothetical protein
MRVACWAVALVFVAGLLAVLADLLRARRAAGLDMPAFSVHSDAADGLAQAADVLRRLGWTPEALTRPVQVTRHRGLLVLVVPPARSRFRPDEPVSAQDAEGLLRWVAAGNTLLLCAGRTTHLHQALGVLVTEEAEPDEAFTPVTLEDVGAYTHGVTRLSVGTRATLQPGPDAMPLWLLEGQPGALLVGRGMGRVIVVADPRWISGEGLVGPGGGARDDNVVFLANVVALHAAGGEVYFDEYHHGIRSGGGFWAYLDYHGQRWTLLVALPALAVAAWRGAVRLGPAVASSRLAAADAVDYAAGLGRLYQRAGARRRLARALVRGFVGDLTRHLRLRPGAVPAEVLAAWHRRPGRPAGGRGSDAAAARLQELLRAVTTLRKGEASERELLAWTRAFDQFLKTEVVSRQ